MVEFEATCELPRLWDNHQPNPEATYGGERFFGYTRAAWNTGFKTRTVGYIYIRWPSMSVPEVYSLW